MKYSQVSRLADHVLLHNLAELVARDRSNLAEMLAHLAEVDTRHLYRSAAYPSMYQYCVGDLRMSEDAAFKRIQAARAAREHPAIFAMIEDGRLTLTAVVLLAPHLTRASAEGLLAAGALKTKAQIALLLAGRFPQPDLVTRVQPVMPASSACQLVPEPVGMTSPEHVPVLAVAAPTATGPERMTAEAPRARIAPLAPQRFAIQVTVSQCAHDKLRYAQALLGHAVPSGDVSEVLERALDALIQSLEKQRFAATARSRPRRGAPKGRHVPADVRRKVWLRDGGKCTFVSDKGHHCEARTRLELDHVIPVARGGTATEANLRLRCRAHNQHAAECMFGRGFMDAKRQGARAQVTQKRAASGQGRQPGSVPNVGVDSSGTQALRGAQE